MRSFGGEGGRSPKDHIGSQGGGQDGPKKDRIIFERSLILVNLISFDISIHSMYIEIFVFLFI